MEKLTILNQKENPFFNRKEIEFEIESSITPKKSEAEELISKELSTSIENVKIKKIRGKFGSNKFTINANVYQSKEDKEQTEPKSKKEKKTAGENK